MKGRIFKSVAVALFALASHLAHAGTVTYVYTDPQGTPLAEANASGTITATFDYKPYGSQALGSPKAGPGYTGHVNDPDTGFVYMQARYYDPVVGRFLSVDPVVPEAEDVFGFNRYNYAHDNAIANKDPDGRKIEFDKGVSPQYKKDFAAAVKYLNNGKVSGQLADLQKSSTVVTVGPPQVAGDDSYDPSTKRVSWDSRSALKNTNGSKQTPALGLLHEVAHAVGDVKGQTPNPILPDKNYSNTEEKRVIQNIETPAAKKLGEGVRTDHNGTPYPVKCAACIK